MSDEPSASALPTTEATTSPARMDTNEQENTDAQPQSAKSTEPDSVAPAMPMDVDNAPSQSTPDIKDAGSQQQQQQPSSSENNTTTTPDQAPSSSTATTTATTTTTTISSVPPIQAIAGDESKSSMQQPSSSLSPGITSKPIQHQESTPVQQPPTQSSSSQPTPTPQTEPNAAKDTQSWPQTTTAAPTSTPNQQQQQQQQQEKPTQSGQPEPVSASPPPSSKQPVATTSEANGYRPLNVKDALTYLDQVKIQFADRPEIYNQFLDIMKDFKSQSIDTPGVIERVSTLFQGHPALISGFNTFLPPGYKIECSVDERSRNVIKVTTPSGTTATTDGEPLMLSSSSTSGYYQHYRRPTGPGYGSQEPVSMLSHPSISYHHQTRHQEDPHTRRTPVEFNHAINYVNKIKNRFSSEPDTYKQFLEILQTYQKDQRPIQEVYAQVQTLFNGAQDLLDEFKQFLPEASGAEASESMKALFGTTAYMGKRGSLTTSGLGESARKKRMSGTSTAGLSKLSKKDIQVSDVRSAPVDMGEDVDDWQPAQATVSAEEAEFFDRVKKYIGNKATYRSFLKLLNLFSQQILDQHLLVTRVESFIGGNRELFEWFKSLVGYNEKEEIVDNEPRSKDKLDLSRCESYGPSYRRVPKEWRGGVCSGRDALCNEVLNDQFVSHPRWASEDTEFVASKKNHFEEALHRVEEERYDYDLSIEANLNTIALLEPISKKISVMNLEEKSAFRLPPGLGGPSKAIYQHIIKKIYGKERGMDIIELVHSNPVATVPILLKRLKQKDEEWKRAQREWNKIWREVENRNYYKALDHQGVTFKNGDKKTMSSQSLLSEIENIRNSQPEIRHFSKGKSVVVQDGANRLPPQLSFTFRDQHTFKDVTRLIFSFLERQEIYNQHECDSVRTFIENLIPLLFDLNDVLPDEKLPEWPDLEDEGEDTIMTEADDAVAPANDGDSDSRRLPTPSNQPDSNDDRQTSQDTKMEEKDAEDAAQDDSDAKENTQSMETDKISTITLFGNDNLYCFLRLFQLAYSRLLRLKQIDAAYRKHPLKTKKEYKAAVDVNSNNVTLHGVEMDFSHGYYYALLDLVDIFFDGSVDQTTLEECARYMFGSKGYMIFTIDKLVMLLVRHVRQIITDDQSRGLVEAFQKFRDTDQEHTAQELAEYKSRAEKDIIGLEENIYGFTFDPTTRILTIQLLDEEDYALETDARIAYNSYVVDFADFNVPTAGLDASALKKQFLKRNINGKREREDNDAYVYPGMQYKISKESYHMFYIIDTEDAFIRKRKQRRSDASTIEQRQKQWTSWLESENGWHRNVENKSQAQNEAKALLEGKAKASNGDEKPPASPDMQRQTISSTPPSSTIPSSSSPRPEHPSTPTKTPVEPGA